MNKNKFIAEFFAFAQEYDFEDPIISLKFQHALSVANFCLEIADFLMLSEDEKQTTFVLGLVHEIGGFAAWRDNKEFVNNTQTLHILFEKKHIDNYKLSPAQNKAIEYALNLFYSSSNALADLENYTKPLNNPQEKFDEIMDYYKILKDADTLDMFGIMKRGSMPIAQSENFSKPTLSRDVLQSFNSGKKIEAAQVKSNLDKVLFFISFYFGLNFSVSKVFAKKMDFTSGVLHNFSDRLSETETERARKIVANFLKKH